MTSTTTSTPTRRESSCGATRKSAVPPRSNLRLTAFTDIVPARRHATAATYVHDAGLLPIRKSDPHAAKGIPENKNLHPDPLYECHAADHIHWRHRLFAGGVGGRSTSNAAMSMARPCSGCSTQSGSPSAFTVATLTTVGG